jgi:hypothetical protein
MWQAFLQDAKERFLKFETAHGIFLVPAGIITLLVCVFYTQYILHAMAFIIGGSAIIYGLYAIFHNPIKKAINTEALKIARLTQVIPPK